MFVHFHSFFRSFVRDEIFPSTQKIFRRRENSNKKFDTFLSIPNEHYGFSNNAPVFFGPPNFEDAAVFVEQNNTTEIEIELR